MVLKISMVTCWYRNISMGFYSSNLVASLRSFPFVSVRVISSHCRCIDKFTGTRKIFQEGDIEFVNFPPYISIPPKSGIGWIIKELFQNISNLFRGFFFLSKSKDSDILHYQQSSFLSFGIFPLIPIVLIPTEKRKVVTIHSLHKAEWRKLLRLVYNKADAVIVHSEAARSELASLGIKPSLIKLIPHGVTIPPVLAKTRDIITFFGAPTESKGAFVLLEALRLLKEEGDSVRVHFYGICSSAEKEAFLGQAKKLQVDDRVVWGGRLSELEFDTQMQSSMFTFAVYPYPVSGSSIVTRALANGAPIITTEIGGMVEYAGDSAISVPPNDPKALADAILKLENNHELRESMSNIGRSKSYEVSWQNTSKKTLEVYLDVLGKNRLNRKNLSYGNRLARPAILYLTSTRMPIGVQIETTTRCNLSCKSCPRLPNLNEDMPFATFMKILDQLENSPQLPIINFTGLGEPLLNSNILSMITEAKSRGFRVGFISNFSVVNQDIIDTFIDVQLDFLQVSVDGSSSKASENLRRNSHFEKTLEKIRAFVGSKTERESSLPTLTILSTLTEENIGEVYPLVNLAESLGVDEIRFARAHGTNVEMAVSAKAWSKSLTSFLGKGSKEDGLSCLRGIYITYDGRVLPCPHLMMMVPRTEYEAYQMGNIYKNSISEIWFSRRYRIFRALRVLGKRCRNCPSKYSCFHMVFQRSN